MLGVARDETVNERQGRAECESLGWWAVIAFSQPTVLHLNATSTHVCSSATFQPAAIHLKPFKAAER